jgi:hypothetical protein
MTAYTSHLKAVDDVRSRRDRVAELVGRYPDISDRDRREILSFMREGRHLDIGLLTTNEKIRPKLDRFMRDHQSHFGVTAGEAAAAVAGIGLLLMVLWLVWAALT